MLLIAKVRSAQFHPSLYLAAKYIFRIIMRDNNFYRANSIPGVLSVTLNRTCSATSFVSRTRSNNGRRTTRALSGSRAERVWIDSVWSKKKEKQIGVFPAFSRAWGPRQQSSVIGRRPEGGGRKWTSVLYDRFQTTRCEAHGPGARRSISGQPWFDSHRLGQHS